MFSFSKRIVLTAVALAGASNAAGTVQLPGLKLPPTAAANAAFVKGMFSDAYETYMCVLSRWLTVVAFHASRSRALVVLTRLWLVGSLRLATMTSSL